ncbi:ring finger protein [Capsaspora owczarzaki ATCC 30864]|uniref:Ring finger protein n=1 Tax=Capsaspora owczarzaki (strain ATCC 30864) TaxID=595528 RepID=A0A0D2WWN1_CAPO3|nr:ring finger protein [Capsaspora owczarzaki ATCC 30864]
MPLMLQVHSSATFASTRPTMQSSVSADISTAGRASIGGSSCTQTDPCAPDKTPPPRPQGQRPDPAAEGPGPRQHPFNAAFNGFFPQVNVGNGVTVTAGFGFFPSLFGLTFSSMPMNGVVPGSGRTLTPLEQQHAALSRMFLFLGIMIIFALLLY